jgi:hypothetical protein
MEGRDETGQAEITEIGRVVAPWGRELVVHALTYDSGMQIARLRIREGKRFTTLDLDVASTEWLTAALRQAVSQATAK